MHKPKVKTSYSNLGDANLAVLAGTVVTALTDNANFTGLTEALTALNTTLSAYLEAVEKSKSRDRQMCALKNQVRENLTQQLQSLAANINSQANFDKAKLSSSGFTLALSGEGQSVIEPPKNFNIGYTGNPNELLFSATKPKQAKGLIFEFTYDDIYNNETPVWENVFSSKNKLVISNMRPGVQIFGRAKVLGSRNRTMVSNTLQKTVPS